MRFNRPDVDQFLSELSARQYLEWRAALEVLNLDDGWVQTGVICQEMHRFANAQTGNKEKPPTPGVFHPKLLVFGEQKKQADSKYLTVEEMKARAKRRANL